MMSKFLGFPYIVEEPAAHLFGVPHGHEHYASVQKSKWWLKLGSKPQKMTYTPTERVAGRVKVHCRSVCLQKSHISIIAR